MGFVKSNADPRKLWVSEVGKLNVNEISIFHFPANTYCVP